MYRFILGSIRPVRCIAASVLAGGAFLASSAPLAPAGTSEVTFQSSKSVHNLGSFDGTATLADDVLTLSVTNEAKKGFLYGFAFDAEDGGAVVFDRTDKRGFKSTAGKKGVKLNPFGRYGVELFDVSGNKHAIAAGATDTFTFEVDNLPAGATAYDLLNNPAGLSMVGLFRGFKHGAMDKAGATVVIPPVLPSNRTPVLLGSVSSTTDNTGVITPIDLPVPTKTVDPTAPVTSGTPSGGNGGAKIAAIPLPMATGPGLMTLGLLAACGLRRKSLRKFA